ncbi:MAG: serine acetyltransferase [Bacteroidales bacterium]|jgi:serine O-acetyltransferase|nr:serine acetyltransferase [Bacteroidales bacterium]
MKTIDVPDPKLVESTINCIFELLFQIKHPLTVVEEEEKRTFLQNQLTAILTGLTDKKDEVVHRFLDKLDEIQTILLKDAGFILESDPAATELREVIAIYPGFYAIFCYRTAHLLTQLSIPLLPRMITEHAHRITGIDIHPLASIGNPFSIDHGTGIVIGETTQIGNFVKMYQGVTLGALSVEKNKASKKRHPTIEDHVILYAGCTILGGETVVGRNSVIGGNVWLTKSILPFSVVYNKSEIIVRNHPDFKDPVDFII